MIYYCVIDGVDDKYVYCTSTPLDGISPICVDTIPIAKLKEDYEGYEITFKKGNFFHWIIDEYSDISQFFFCNDIWTKEELDEVNRKAKILWDQIKDSKTYNTNMRNQSVKSRIS